MSTRASTLALALLALVVALLWRSRRAGESVSGRVVLITGASRGLGLAIAEEFAEQGARIAICSRDTARLEHARARIAARGAEVYAQQCDVRDREAVETLVRDVTERFGQIDILVNNAGIIVVAPAVTRSVSDIEDAMDVMLWGPVYATYAVLPQMRERGDGVIVNVTSVGGKVSVPHLLPYSTAKFAAVAFSEGLRAELAPEGISVVTVVPGLMRTGSYLNARFGGQHRREFAWFSILGNLPLVSMDARRAARRIVRAARRREAEVTLTWFALAGARVYGLMPGLSNHVMRLVDRFILPAPPARGGEETPTGWESRSALSESFLTALGRSAARDLLQESPRVTG